MNVLKMVSPLLFFVPLFYQTTKLDAPLTSAEKPGTWSVPEMLPATATSSVDAIQIASAFLDATGSHEKWEQVRRVSVTFYQKNYAEQAKNEEKQYEAAWTTGKFSYRSSRPNNAETMAQASSNWRATTPARMLKPRAMWILNSKVPQLYVANTIHSTQYVLRAYTGGECTAVRCVAVYSREESNLPLHLTDRWIFDSKSYFMLASIHGNTGPGDFQGSAWVHQRYLEYSRELFPGFTVPTIITTAQANIPQWSIRITQVTVSGNTGDLIREESR